MKTAKKKATKKATKMSAKKVTKKPAGETKAAGKKPPAKGKKAVVKKGPVKKAPANKAPAKKGMALKLQNAKMTLAVVATTLDKETCAGHVFGETSVLSNNAAKLVEARRFIAGVAYKRNGTGMAPAKIPTENELKNPNTKAIWNRCLQAAGDAQGDDVGTCKHFVVWFSDDDGKTPSKKPSRITDDWPYDQTDKIKGNWGPFTSPVTPEGDNIFVIKYCGVA